MAIVELADVQADVASPHPGAAAHHLFFRFPDLARCASASSRAERRRVSSVLAHLRRLVTPADIVTSRTPATLVVAVTGPLLDKIGLPEHVRATLPSAFLQGMRVRAADLGDMVQDWRAPFTDEPVDILALVRYRGADHGVRLVEQIVSLVRGAGGELVLDQAAHGLRADRSVADPADEGPSYEHFGFRDGLSNPVLEGTPRALTAGNGVLQTRRPSWFGMSTVALDRPRWRRIKPGEFLLGYEDEMGELNLLPQNAGLLRNASYLVWRKLQQDVDAFERAVTDHGDKLVTAIVGRQRDGTPLVPHATDATMNDFTFADEPAASGGCPVDAHIRRMNPRAGIDLADDVVRRHRIVRRSMPYTERDEGPTSRGLLFLCYQADIERQFEFVQRQWLARGDLLRLGSEPDALAGQAPTDGTIAGSKTPVRPSLPAFVSCLGGEYFLVPGLLGLDELARIAGSG